jgi:penicillin-insensitive murein endopeptidase
LGPRVADCYDETMRCGPASSDFSPPTLVAVLVALALAVGPSASAGPPAESKTAKESTSIGTPMKGSLTRGEVLPKKGSGYLMLKKTRDRRARFGVSELVYLVKDAAHKVYRRHRGSVLLVGDLSSRKGGPLENHGSHQNGRDVDLLFYVLDKSGEPVSPELFIPFDRNGYSVEPPMEYRFDTARNWALVEALIRSNRASVQWIFVADHLKQLLLDYATTHKAPRSVIGKARQILRQPGKKAHWDHFHVRIYCPADDRPACEDVGPRWAWVR